MNDTRQIDVRDQAKLSYGKIFELVRSGITHRLLRSTLTMSVILLAVAFFMFSLSESSIINAVDQGVQAEIVVQRRTPHLLSHITAKPTTIQMSARLDRIADDEQAVTELATVTGWEPGRIDRLIDEAEREQRYLHFFRSLSPGKRIALFAKAKEREIFRALNEERAWRRFTELFDNMPELRLPTDYQTFHAFVQDFPGYLEELTAFQQAWNAQIEDLGRVMDAMRGDMLLDQWLVECSEEEYRAWVEAIRAHGFQPADTTIEAVRHDLQIKLRLADIQQMLKTQEKQQQWLRIFRYRAKMEEMLDRLDEPQVAEKLLEGRYTIEELREVMETRAYETRLAELETNLSAVVGDRRGEAGLLSNRQVFLLTISFVVCMVGIANAMLMAITERFREIATMKCLGATDRFILVQFMMEAGLQGIAGGVLGMMIGFLLTFLKMIALYGGYPVAYFPVGAVLICAGVSLLTGILLAIIASIYPSYSASRMAPMEAMRIE